MWVWNIHGWTNVLSDKYYVKLKSIVHANVDILGIGETHLIGSQAILIPGFTWYGQNRTELHRRARTSSGGIGFLFSDAFLENFDITVLDDNTDGMMWVSPTQDSIDCS